jgi:hypothetical protein
MPFIVVFFKCDTAVVQKVNSMPLNFSETVFFFPLALETTNK